MSEKMDESSTRLLNLFVIAQEYKNNNELAEFSATMKTIAILCEDMANEKWYLSQSEWCIHCETFHSKDDICDEELETNLHLLGPEEQ